MSTRTNVVILHGIGSKPGEHWQSWLHDRLVELGAHVAMPALPDTDDPDRFAWLDTASRAMDELGDGIRVFVGHSLGVATALDCIETAGYKVDAIVSVAGFGADYGLELNGAFLRQRTVDFEAVRANLTNAFVFYGDNDPWVTQAALQELARNLHVSPVVVPNGGHLNTSAGFVTFPALLDVMTKVVR